MTIEATGGKVGRFGRRRSASSSGELLPIGEVDANIFNCPACARPLGIGASHCPGCGTRLIAGVQAKRAISFLGLGLVAGLMIGGAVMSVANSLDRATPATVVVEAPPVVTPSQLPIASVGLPVVDPGIPSGALSALRQSTVVNQRILADADRLAAILAAPRPSPTEIAPILRALAATAAFGDGVASQLGTWDDGAAVSQALASFYASIGGVAREGLAASNANTRAYLGAAKRMLGIIDGVTDLDAASQALASRAEVELPPLHAPDDSAP